MSSIFLSRFFVLRAAVIAVVCLIALLAALVLPLARGLAEGGGDRGGAQLAPIVLLPLVAAPALLALGER